MVGLSKVSLKLVLLALILSTGVESKGHNKRAMNFPNEQNLAWLCAQLPSWIVFNECQPYLNPTTAATSPSAPGEVDETTATTSSYTLDTSVPNTSPSTTVSPVILEREHWCRFSNGSYIPPGFTFMNNACTICQCRDTRDIRCAALQCMSTHCIDNNKPLVRKGECCGQCAYEPSSVACVYNGFTFPHGTVIKTQGDTLKCWCQLGSIECRQSTASVFSELDVLGEGTTVYVMIIIMFVLLIIGTLLCCACSGVYYYYYQRSQQSAQEAYDQYWTTAGWQPMNEDGTVAESSAEEKQAEAEQNHHQYDFPAGFSEAYIPPPYAIYKGSYESESPAQQQ